MKVRTGTGPALARRCLAVALLTSVLGMAGPVLAQTSPSPTTTVAPSTSTTTNGTGVTTTLATKVPPDGGPTSTVASSTTTLPAPQPVDTKTEDNSTEPPPQVVVPPRTAPRVVTPVDQAVNKALADQLKAAQQAANEAVAASQASDRALALLEADQAKLERTFESLHADEAAAAQRLVEQRRNMRERAIALYIAGPGEPVVPLGNDIQEYGRRRVLIQAVHAADRRKLDQYLQAKTSAGGDLDVIISRLEDLNAKVLAARADSEAKAAATQIGLRSVGTAQAGGQLAIGGFAFPVAEPHNFVDTFGAPRSGGRQHQGNDIFAPYGTPLYAAERGVVERMGLNTLGGIKLWITGESGTAYYYAHLSAYALNLVDGTVVEAGDVVGFVGNTGDAITTPPHLHFEIHPVGGPAIDPYTILKAADDATRRQAVISKSTATTSLSTARP